MEPKWLEWARELEAVAQTGISYAEDPFDVERYERVKKVAAGMLAEGTGVEPERMEDIMAHEVGYATPKVGVRSIVFRENAILLVQETSDGLWAAPGGWAEVTQSPAENAAKEVFEETGFEVRVVKLLGLYDRGKHLADSPSANRIYEMYFLCEITGGAPKGSIETERVGFFREDDLPELSPRRQAREQVLRCFEHHRHPEWPADFD